MSSDARNLLLKPGQSQADAERAKDYAERTQFEAMKHERPATAPALISQREGYTGGAIPSTPPRPATTPSPVVAVTKTTTAPTAPPSGTTTVPSASAATPTTVETPAAVRLRMATDIATQLKTQYGLVVETARLATYMENPLASDLVFRTSEGTVTVPMAEFERSMKDYEVAYAKYSKAMEQQILARQETERYIKWRSEVLGSGGLISGGFVTGGNVSMIPVRALTPTPLKTAAAFVFASYTGGVVLGAAAKTLAPVASGVAGMVGKADIFAKLAEHVSPAVQTMYEVEKGAIIYAAPHIASQVGMIAMTGIETYKAKGMYEAGVPIPDIALSVGMDVAAVVAFAGGVRVGYEAGLPPRVERALIGTPKLFVKGEYVEFPTAKTLFYEAPSISYPEGAEAFFKRTGGLFSRLTAPFGQVPIEPGMVLPASAVSLPSGEVSEEWGLVSSMRLQQVETWARMQPFKLGVPLEKGTEIIDSRLIGVQALGETQSIRYWAGVSAKSIEYTPFEGELFEPWALTKIDLSALKTYVLVPKELITASTEGWAQLQLNVARTIYPAGVLYPERQIGILNKEWYTTKMYDVGRAMDQITSLYITTPGRVVGESFAKIQFELTPARTYAISGAGPIGYGAKALESIGGLKLSDSIIVAGGGAVQAPNWTQQAQLLRRQVELLEPAEEMFSPFVAHPLAGPSVLQRGLPSVETIMGAGAGVGLLNLVSVKAEPTFKQSTGGLPALTQAPTPIEIVGDIPVVAITQAPIATQLLATIQAATLITPTITITPPISAPPITPTFPPFVPILPSDFVHTAFFPKKRKAKIGGKKYTERLWYVGPLEPKMSKLKVSKAFETRTPKLPKLNVKSPKFPTPKMPKLNATKMKIPKARMPRMKKMRGMV